MKKTIITSDSPIDLSTEQRERFGIKTIPLHVVLEGKDNLDGIDITPDEMYKVYEAKKILPSTSAVSVAEYEEFFKEMTEDGAEVVHISLSSAISATHQNAKIAAESFDGVYVVDSRRLSSGIALLAIKAKEMSDAGMPAREIAEKAEAMRDKVSTSFILETLEFMRKGGRCSAVAAFGANLLGIKPSIQNANDGTLGVSKKYRGKLDVCRKQYIQDAISGDGIDYSRIFVTHSGMEQSEIDDLVQFVQEHYDFKEVIVCRAGCTISTHCGPGTMGVLFMYL